MKTSTEWSNIILGYIGAGWVSETALAKRLEREHFHARDERRHFAIGLVRRACADAYREGVLVVDYGRATHYAKATPELLAVIAANEAAEAEQEALRREESRRKRATQVMLGEAFGLDDAGDPPYADDEEVRLPWAVVAKLLTPEQRAVFEDWQAAKAASAAAPRPQPVRRWLRKPLKGTE